MCECSEHFGWACSLILNMISPLFPSCWGFSFAPGGEASPQSHPRTTEPLLQHCSATRPEPPIRRSGAAQPAGVSLPLYVGYLLKVAPAPQSPCFSAAQLLGQCHPSAALVPPSLLGFLCPGMWGISSKSIQCHAAATPVPQDWERSVFIPIPKKGNTIECANY